MVFAKEKACRAGTSSDRELFFFRFSFHNVYQQKSTMARQMDRIREVSRMTEAGSAKNKLLIKTISMQIRPMPLHRSRICFI